MLPTELLNTPYLNLGTYRKSGVQVNTPVWFAHDGEQLFVLSAGEAGKIKRLRNSSRCRIAACNYSGKLTGPWHQSQAFLMAENEIPIAHRLFVKKYGWQMKIFDLFSRIGGRYHKRAYIRICPHTP